MILKFRLSAMLMALFLLADPAGLYSQPARLEENYPNPQRVFRWDRAERLLGFKSVEKLASVHSVAAGGQVRALPAASSAKGQALVEALKKPTAEFMKTGDIVGVMIVHDGEVLVEEYGRGFSAADRWTSFSVAKSVTGTLVGAAVKDGLIALDDQVVKYIPELKGSAYDGVTIRHLLTMTSGVQWDEDYSDPDSDTARLALGVGDESKDQLADLAALPRMARPGEYFDYKTGESNLLGMVVMRATGRSLADYLSEKIWKPYGMETEAYWAVDSQNRELAGCCLSPTLRDYARFGLFILEDGRAADKNVLPEGWLEEATKPVLGHMYGYQWHLIADQLFAASGIFGQMVAIDKASGSVAVILSAWDRPLSSKGQQERIAYLMAVRTQVLKHGGGTKKRK